MKTKVYNLIILDESGSMSSIKRQAIEGVNQTFSTIRQGQLSNEDQEHMVTFITFDSNHTNTVYDKTPIKDVKDITSKDYNPGGCTPLYDAMGFALTNLRAVATQQDLVLVTIITDGYENASHEYTGKAIKALVGELRQQQDWIFTYIGANQDVERVADSLGVSNSMAFQEDEEGTRAMFAKESRSRGRLYGRFAKIMDNAQSDDNDDIMFCFRECKKEISEGYFDEEK